jgi:hypothetical protein
MAAKAAIKLYRKTAKRKLPPKVGAALMSEIREMSGAARSAAAAAAASREEKLERKARQIAERAALQPGKKGFAD